MSASAVVNAVALVFPAAMVYAGWRDVVSFEVPNWVSVGLVAAFAALAAAAGLAMTTVAWHLAAGAAVLIVGWILFAFGVVGGADAKLLAAAAVWTGFSALAEFLLVVALLGGALAIGLVVWRRVEAPRRWAGREWVRRLHDRDAGMPYCAAIGCAGLWIFPSLPLVVVAAPGVAGSGA